jgi:hypothetical protein
MYYICATHHLDSLVYLIGPHVEIEATEESGEFHLAELRVTIHVRAAEFCKTDHAA